MKSLAELEKEILELPHDERQRLAFVVWSSLEEHELAEGLNDPQGLATAQERDKEIDNGHTQPLQDSDFRRLTGGAGNREG